MVIDERARNQLYQRLEAVLGPEEATILMKHLPPVGWADVATKHDLDALAEVLRLEIKVAVGEVKREISDMRSDIRGELLHMSNRFTAWVITSMIGVGGLVFAAVRFV